MYGGPPAGKPSLSSASTPSAPHARGPSLSMAIACLMLFYCSMIGFIDLLFV